jgi:PAS domain S-box-containing protein
MFVAVWQVMIEPTLRKGVLERQSELAHLAGNQIDYFLEQRVQRLYTVAEIGRFWELRDETEKQKQILQRLLKLDPQIQEVAICDQEGRQVVRLSRQKVLADTDLVNVSQEPEFRQAIQGNLYISPVQYAPTAEPFVTVAVPIRFTVAENKGVVLADVSLKTLWNSVANLSEGASALVFVTDETGKLIAHPDYSKVLLEGNVKRGQTAAEPAANSSSKSTADRLSSADRKQTIVTRAEIPRTRWVVYVEEPEETALRDLRAVTKFSFAILALTLVGAFGISAYFSRRITVPMKELEQGAKLIGEGRLDQRLDIRTGDEIEILAGEFNRMAGALKASYQGLEERIAARTRDLQKEIAERKETEDVLRKSEDRKGAILESALDGIITMDHQGKIIEFNPAAEKMFGYDRFEVIGRSMAELVIPPYLRARHERGLTNYAATGKGPVLGNRIEMPAMRADGSEFLAELSILRVGTQEPPIFTGFIRDLTERKQAEGRIQQSLKQLQALHEIDQAITSTLDLPARLNILLEKIDLFFPFPSATTIRLFNKESGGIDFLACCHMDEAEWKRRALTSQGHRARQAIDTKSPVIVRNITSGAQNPEFYLKEGLASYIALPLIVKDEVIGALGLYTKEEHDFTQEEIGSLETLAGQAAVAIHSAQLYEETRLRESQLQETNRMLSALYSVAAAASQSLDLDRVLQAVIDKITDIFRFDATRIHIYNEQKDELLLRASFANDPDRFTDAHSFKKDQGIVGKVAKSGAPLIFEDIETDPLYLQLSRTKVSERFGYHFFAVFPIKDKVKCWGTLGCVGTAPRRLESGEIQLLQALADHVAVALENTRLYDEVKQNVQQLQQKTYELEQANKTKDEFLSVMSHELRTPLNVVLGYTGLIKEGVLGEINPEQNKALEKVMRRAQDQLSMINAILQATLIEAGRVAVKSHEVGLEDLLGDLRSDYDPFGEKDLTISWDYSPELPAIKTDGEKLKQILWNLISNAIKFTEKGNVSISADYLPETNRVRFKVADTGIGIPKEALGTVFDKFHQVDSSATRLYEGVGLGLYIVKKFADMLGGEITVESETGKGSVFTLLIPYETAPLLKRMSA